MRRISIPVAVANRIRPLKVGLNIHIVYIHRMLCKSGTNTFFETPYISRGLSSKSFRLIYGSSGSDNPAKSYRGGRMEALLIIL